jgi:hypothetical protein
VVFSTPLLRALGGYPCPEGEDELKVWFDWHDTYLQQILAGMVRLEQALADLHLASMVTATITENS